jgi:sugar phosphate isomerase/epimerase
VATPEMERASSLAQRRRVAMSQVTTYPWTLAEDLSGYARHGYRGIEIWQNKVAGEGAPYHQVPSGQLPQAVVQGLVGSLSGAGMQAVSVVCTGLFTSPGEQARLARAEHLGFSVRFAAEIGASCVLVVPGDLNGMTRGAAVERTARALEEVLPEAHRLGVDLAIEPLRPVHTDFVNTIPQAMEIVDLVDDRRCGLCMDTYQLWRGEGERDAVIEEIREAASWARIVQVADSRPVPRSTEDRLVPGEGVLPIAEMLAAVFAAGYEGWLAVEIMSSEMWAGDLDDVLERCRLGMGAVIAEADRLARGDAPAAGEEGK